MLETPHRHHFSTTNTLPKPPISHPRRKLLSFPSLSSKNTSLVSLPPKPHKSQLPPPPNPPNSIPPSPPNADFQQKLIYFDSIGIDFLSFLSSHPPILSTPIPSIKSTISLLYSIGLTPPDLRRAASMCPEILSAPTSSLVPVFTFLLREAHVQGRDLRHVIHRRPRLLICSVELQLRPTLYFLQSTVGICKVNKLTHLLSCSVESKLIPRIEYFQQLGFSNKDTIAMFRRFPSLFCYSIKENLEPKFNYFVIEMGRNLKELKEFPHYFSFSLENRIKPRHKKCVEKRVCLSLPVMLKSSEERFRDRLEVFYSSSMPDHWLQIEATRVEQ
ncbi:protein SEEDLING LETHAL 1, chloroplastic isoform X1 [Daucus carota subsp. sativus]|uniref:protein SEEDLING LETHAL 1, chloroplastic isoform X1 n=1 Tax=Daucus carota subsp. sativus TaxID=79200 RepID=UPI0030831935